MKNKLTRFTSLIALTGMLAITLPALRADDAPAPAPADGAKDGGCQGKHHGGKGKHHGQGGDEKPVQTPAPAQ